MMTMQPFLAYKQALQLRDIERSHAQVAHGKDVGTGAGKEMESSPFPLPITTSPLTNMFACHKWRGC